MIVQSQLSKTCYSADGLAPGPQWGAYSAPDPHVYIYPTNISGSATVKELDE